MLSSCSEKCSFMKKLYHFLLVLYPILSGYGLSLSLDFGSIFLFLCGVGCVITYPREFRIKTPIGYKLFFIVALLLSLVWARSIPLRLLLFSINLCFACCYAEKELLWRYYNNIVWICVAFFLVQEASFHILGTRPSGIVSFIPTVYGDDVSRSVINVIMHNERSSSLFLEPSYFAQFLIPYVAISLFSVNKDERKKAIIVSVILLLVRSGVGIMLLGIIWLLWFMYSNIKARTKIVLFVLMILALGVLVYASGLDMYLLDRSSELLSYSGDEQYQSSGFVRIFRGYLAFADLSVLNMLLGSNPTDVQLLLDRSIYFGQESTNFINGMQTLLFYHGIIGTIIYLRHILLLPYKTRNKTLLVLSISIIILLLLEQFYLSSRLFVMMMFMHLMREESKRSQFEIRKI